MDEDEIRAVLTDPVAQRLFAAPVHARLAYTARDGSPRVVPIGYVWDGAAIIMGSATTSPKVASLVADPRVAITIDTEDFPPTILLVRGTATVTRVEGVPDEFVEAARRFVGEAGMPEWEAGARALYREMALIRVVPTWAKIIDFDTRLPDSYAELTQGSATAS